MELSELSFEIRKENFIGNIIPSFESFADKFDFDLTFNFKEYSRIFLKKEDLEIYLIEEYRPREIYLVTFVFPLIDKVKKQYNISNLKYVKNLNISFELNCVKEKDLIKLLNFFNSLFKKDKFSNINALHQLFLDKEE